jgi:adenine/guanine phosphoribosyltransferase-like PRPP-binding protein
MIRRYTAQRLIQKLDRKVKERFDLQQTLLLGVVLKGLPVAYSLARMNNVIKNFVPLVAERPFTLQHYVESYFPSLDWKSYFQKLLKHCNKLLIIDDVVNSGFTKQKLESIVYSLTEGKIQHSFAALVLNRELLANPKFIRSKDIFALQVKADEVECDWGLEIVPLWNLSVEESILKCETYFQRFWLNEQRVIKITY